MVKIVIDTGADMQVDFKGNITMTDAELIIKSCNQIEAQVFDMFTELIAKRELRLIIEIASKCDVDEDELKRVYSEWDEQYESGEN